MQLEVLQYDRRGQGILLKIAVLKMSTIKVKKVKMATKSCPECDQQVRFCLSINDIFMFLLKFSIAGLLSLVWCVL